MILNPDYKMDLRCALAVNRNNQFEKKHFGDADKFLIYQKKNDRFELISEEVNLFKRWDEEGKHGSKRKGNTIIEILKGNKVNVLISRQFGKNIKLINQHFIPVVVSTDQPAAVCDILARHLHLIVDEWEGNKSNYKLFTITSGVLKPGIKK